MTCPSNRCPAQELRQQLADEKVSNEIQSSLSRIEEVRLRQQSEIGPLPTETLVMDNVLQRGSSLIPSDEGGISQQSKVTTQIYKCWGNHYELRGKGAEIVDYRVQVVLHDTCK